MTDEYNPDLDDEQIQRLKNSEVIRMAVACDEVSEALRFIRTKEKMRTELVGTITAQSTRVSSEETVGEIIDLLLGEMDRRAGMVRPVEAETEEETDE